MAIHWTEAQIEEIESQISDNMDDMREIVEQKNLIDQQVFLLYAQIQNINDQITAYGDLIANKQEELDFLDFIRIGNWCLLAVLLSCTPDGRCIKGSTD